MTDDNDHETRREHIENTLSDLIGAFLYYDRKEDEDLPRGSIEEAVAAGEITVEEMVEQFKRELGRSIERTIVERKRAPR